MTGPRTTAAKPMPPLQGDQSVRTDERIAPCRVYYVPMPKSSRELVSATELARYCQVDIKTIHNWAARGDLPHFRTPGRHLRFRRADVLHFLRTYGYPIPGWMLDGPLRVVALGTSSQTAPLGLVLQSSFLYEAFSDPLLFLLELGGRPPEAALIFARPADVHPSAQDVIAALRAHPRTQRTRLVGIGSKGGSPLGSVSVHLADATPTTVEQTLAALLGTGRVTD